jgi:hypothetical protein
MGDIIEFPDGTLGDVPVQGVLEGAKMLDVVCIMGYDKDGNEYFASSCGEIKEINWLLDRYKSFLQEIADDESI